MTYHYLETYIFSDLLARVDVLGRIVCAYHPAPQTDILDVYFEYVLRHQQKVTARQGAASQGPARQGAASRRPSSCSFQDDDVFV